jgi:hypothetical protein
MLKTITFIFACILLLVGCGKDQPIGKGNDPMGLIDWGVVELSVNTPKRLSLGEGKDCILTAISSDQGKLQIKIETKTMEKLVGKDLPPGAADGTLVESIKTVKATVSSGVQVVMSAGQRPVRFTPVLKSGL